MASLSRFVRASILTVLAALGLSAVTSSAGQAKPRKTAHSAKALAIAKNDRTAIAFTSAYEAHGLNHQRYTNERDIVPALPPSVAITTGYAHVGNLVEISTGGSIDPSSTNEPVVTADKHFDPFHSEYPNDLRAAITPQSLQGQMPAVP